MKYRAIAAIIALTVASLFAAVLLTAIFLASLIHPLAPVAIIFAAVVAILVYVGVKKP